MLKKPQARNDCSFPFWTQLSPHGTIRLSLKQKHAHIQNGHERVQNTFLDVLQPTVLPAPRCQLLLLVTITTSDCCFLLLWFLTQHAMAVSTNIVAAVDCCFHNILFIVAVAVMLPSPKATGCCFYSNTTTVSTVTPPLFLQLSSLPLDCCFCSKNVHCRHQLIVDSVALLSQPNSIAVQCAGAGAAIVTVAIIAHCTGVIVKITAISTIVNATG